jgi:predicted glycoside hydrolase/deacetylase ChbG (UPF0249 family)
MKPSPLSPRPLALCADDFGLNPSVGQGIVALAAMGRLQAVSCLVNGPHWPAESQRLLQLPPQTQLGLHFNLTEGQPLSPALRRLWPQLPPVGSLLWRQACGRLPLAALQQELQAQWAVFKSRLQAMGLRPQFLDGHQHMHQLRGVREAVCALARQEGLAVRSTQRVQGRPGGFKARVIEHSGGRALGAMLRAQGLPHNASLLGAYDFQSDYRACMRQWLRELPEQGALLFCHPGQPLQSTPGGALNVGSDPKDPQDPIEPARHREYAYLSSEAFTQDLAQAGVVLQPVWCLHAA